MNKTVLFYTALLLFFICSIYTIVDHGRGPEEGHDPVDGPQEETLEEDDEDDQGNINHINRFEVKNDSSSSMPLVYSHLRLDASYLLRQVPY